MSDSNIEEIKSAVLELRKRLENQNTTVKHCLVSLNTRTSDVEQKIETKFEEFKKFLDENKELSKNSEIYDKKLFDINIQSSKSENQSSTAKAIKEAFFDCMSTSSIHGLAQMSKPSNLLIIIVWIVFILIASGGGCFLIYQTIEQFLRYDVITMTKVIKQTKMIFPAITICSSNNYDFRKTIIECRHGLSDPCYFTDLILYDGQKRNCKQLNFGPNKSELVVTKGEGRVNGYRFIMYNPYDSPLRFTVTDNNQRVVWEDVREEIHQGYLTEIVLSKHNQSELGPPYNQCNDSHEYSEKFCIESCLNDKLSKVCGCEYPLNCTESKCGEAVKYHTSEIKNNCRFNCLPECVSVEYQVFNRIDIKWDFDPINMPIYKENISKSFNITSMSDDEIIKKMTKLYVYLGKLETTQITQSPSMTTSMLVANVGGLLGLFLGFSLLSSIEIIDLLIRIAIILIHQKFKNAKKIKKLSIQAEFSSL